MDPLKTAVKYALIPLRIAVQIGDMFVGDDDEPKATRKPSQASPATPVPPQPKPKPRRARPQASQAPKPLGDTGIARKVETVIFRDPQVPKGQIDVNVVDGLVFLRGEALHPEMIVALEAQAAAIPEVMGVENLLEVPTRPVVKDRPVQTRVTHENRDKPGEPLPRELAKERKGRQPAPLGAVDSPQNSS